METQNSIKSFVADSQTNLAAIYLSYTKTSYHKSFFMSRIMMLALSFRKSLKHEKEVLIM